MAKVFRIDHRIAPEITTATPKGADYNLIMSTSPFEAQRKIPREHLLGSTTPYMIWLKQCAYELKIIRD